ncbi:MAG: trypsin-like peptidase domain-containing protein [Ignavibacteriae bacterium]|nr:trypsin-like peptidase domain-containing protein [Ignavibacteriota bacterium]
MKILSIVCLYILLCIKSASGQVTLESNAIGRVFLEPTDSIPIGTAFVAGDSKSIYTCSHVAVADTLWFNYIGSPEQLFRVTVKYNLPSYDVAFLIRTGGSQPASLQFGDFSRVQPGDTIHYIGWDTPLARYIIRLATVSARGSVLVEEGTKVDFIEFEGQAVPGYSGGPVIDRFGKVIAMIREGWEKTSLRGGVPVRINRAFSIELLRILDSELKGHSNPKDGKSPNKLMDLKQ